MNVGPVAGHGGILATWRDREEEPLANVAARGDRHLSIGTLGPNQAKMLRVRGGRASVPGLYQFRALVDGQGLVAEADESNNGVALVYEVE